MREVGMAREKVGFIEAPVPRKMGTGREIEKV